MSRFFLVALLGIESLAAVAAESGVFIRINQLGFQPRDSKTAVVFGASPLASAFEITELESGKIVWHGETKTMPGVSWGQFHYYALCDFSGFVQSGQYLLQVDGTTSAPFAIGEHIYAALPDELLEFMREQRCGYNPFLDQT